MELRPMHDLPTGSQLLALARAVLLEELMPLLPSERRLDALLIGNCLAIAAREAAAGAGPMPAIDAELRSLYEAAAGCEPVAGDLWRRFAGDLRVGFFANSPDCEARARAVLWRLSIAKLRLANPRFLAANGVGRGNRPGDRHHVP
jgi:hypothetical protein